MNKSDSLLIDITDYSPDGLADKVGERLARALCRISVNEEGAYRGFSNTI
jgi:hypothetical protein